jgi:diketogulonate reductase-like aldo/keto reductase
LVPIPKALHREHLASNIAVFDFQLSEADRTTLRRYDTGYRTLPQLKWLDHPYYPFERKQL